MHFLKSLNAVLPDVPGKHERIAKDKARISAVLESMFVDAYLADDAGHKTSGSEEEASLALSARDGYARIAEIAQGMAKALARKHCETEAEMYSCLAHLFEALKRKHLSQGADHQLDVVVKAIAAKIRLHAPALHEGRPGAGVERNTGGRFFLKGGPLGIFRLGGGMSKSDKLIVDTDGEYNWINHLNLFVEVGAKFKPMLLKRVFKKVVAALRIGGSLGSVFYQSSDLEKIIRMSIIEEANRSAWTSASPRSRMAMEILNGMKNTVASPFRFLSRPANLPLYLNERKIAKGAFNEPAMAMFAERFEDLGGGDLKSLIESAFPGAAATADAALRGRDPMACIPLSEPAGATGKDGRAAPDVYKALNLSAEMSVQNQDSEPVGARWSLGAKLMMEARQVGLERLKPPHAHLDPAYHHNPGVLRKVFSAAESSAGHAASLHLYHEVNQLVGKAFPDARPAVSDGVDATPAESSSGTSRADVDRKLAAFDQAFALLESRYQSFVRAAHMLNSAWDHLGVCPVINLDKLIQQSIRTSFATINHEVWGDGYSPRTRSVPGGCLPGFPLRARFPVETVPLQRKADVRRLLAKSYDALSLALASAGGTLASLKENVLTGPFAGMPEIKDRILKADESYKAVREAIDDVNLPMSRDTLLRQSSITATSVSRKYEVKALLYAGGGVKLDALKAGSNAAGVGDGDGLHLSASNQIGNAAVTAEVSYIYAQHPNPAKQGHFVKIRANASVGFPVSRIAALAPAAFAALAKSGAPAANPPGIGDKLVAQLKNLRLLNLEEQAEINVSLHAPGNAGFALEYQRINFLQATSINATIGYSGVVENIGGEIGIDAGEKVTDPRLEIIGRDLGYHLQQLPKLEAILAIDDDQSLADRFNSNPYRKHQYFGGDAIMSMLEDHADYLSLMREATGSAAEERHQLEAKAAQYGFATFHEDAHAEHLRAAAAHAYFAPGSGNVGTPPDSILQRMRTPRTTTAVLNAARDALNGRLEKARRAGASLLSKSDVRMSYYLEHPDGKKLFAAYLDIVRAYREAGLSLVPTFGYDIHLRGRKDPVRQFVKAVSPGTGVASTPPGEHGAGAGKPVPSEESGAAGPMAHSGGIEAAPDHPASASIGKQADDDAKPAVKSVPLLKNQLLRRSLPSSNYHRREAVSEGANSGVPPIRAGNDHAANTDHAAVKARHLKALWESREGMEKPHNRRTMLDREHEGLAAVDVQALAAKFEAGAGT